MVSPDRTAMVCAGRPSSQRNRFGFANHTLPGVVSGWTSDLRVLVWTKSADHVWTFSCAASHAETVEFVSAARRSAAASRPGSVRQSSVRVFILVLILASILILRSVRLRLRLRAGRRPDR